MTCDEFDMLWATRFDRGARAWPERAIAEHARACERCRVVSAHFEYLAMALRSIEPTGPPSPAFSTRLIRTLEIEARRLRQRRPVHAAARRLAIAAAVLIAAGVGGWAWHQSRRPLPVEAPAEVVVAPSAARPLSEALADATTATLDLARVTSGPATRLGRDLLASSSAALPQWSPPVMPEASPSAGEVLESVGSTLGERIRPLAGSAQSAFSFLIGSPDDKPTANLPAADGA